MTKSNIIKIGQVFSSPYGDCVVTVYKNCEKIRIRFLTTGYKTWVRANHLRVGNVKDVTVPNVYGVGFLGEGIFSRKANAKEYALWSTMLERCYSPRSWKRYPTYKGCKVVKRWHSFQVFCKDIHKMKNWKTRGFQLDKDLRVWGNKKYGPKYCSFVPMAVNGVMLKTQEALHSFKAGRRVYINIGNTRISKVFKTLDEAKHFYITTKSSYLSELVRKYKNALHKEVYLNLLNWSA